MYQRTPNSPLRGAVDAQFVPVESAPAKKEEGNLLQLAQGLISKIRIADLKTDDLLLLAILYFTLRQSGDDDLLLILAALFFTGYFER